MNRIATAAQHTESVPPFDPSGPLLFVVNGAAGHQDAEPTRELIETALREHGRDGEVLLAQGANLASTASSAATRAREARGAVVAVGGDGTINTVAQAAHAERSVLGVVAQGTFNYFARTHGLATDTATAVQALLSSRPQPVQVGTVNGRVFLVNASLGLYPQLLEDREAYKARFGRSRVVAIGAALATLMAEHRRLRLTVELGGRQREVRTQTLFIGNNRLQLEQVGVPQSQALEDGRIAAVMLKPVGSLALLALMLRGAVGKLGQAETVESFEFERMIVRPWLPVGQRRVKVACDGEVGWLASPLEFGVSPRPLHLLQPSVQ